MPDSESTPETGTAAPPFPAEVGALAQTVASALAEILRSPASPGVLQAQELLLQRLALQGDVFSSRIPAPRNITEVGGYLNLLERLGEREIRTQSLAAALGVAGPNPMPGLLPATGLLFDVLRPNDRPEGEAGAQAPVQVAVRNDFAAPLDAARSAIHARGCRLPLLGLAPLGLPAAHPLAPGAGQDPVDPLLYLGRVLRLLPSAALRDPDTDLLALAREGGSGPLQVVARQVDDGAPEAGEVTETSWSAFQCDENACAASAEDRHFLPLAPILNAAGWYQPVPGDPQSLGTPGPWWRWTNLTGLVVGETRLGDELLERYTPAQVAASALRDRLGHRWNGEAFVGG